MHLSNGIFKLVQISQGVCSGSRIKHDNVIENTIMVLLISFFVFEEDILFKQNDSRYLVAGTESPF